MTYWKVDHTKLTLADNTTITAGPAGNAVSPDYWDFVTTGSGGTATFDAPSTSVELYTAAGGGAAQLRKNISTGEVAVEIEFDGRAWPTTSGIRVVEIRNAADTGWAARLTLMPDGTLNVLDAANVSLWSTTGTVPTSSGWRVYMGVKKGTTTTDGTIQCYAYLTGDGKATTGAEVYDQTNVNAGTTDLAMFRCGFTSGGPGMLAVRSAQKEDLLGELGPIADDLTLGKTLSIVQRADYTASTGTGTLTLTAVQQSGPSVGTITVNGLVAEFTDSVARTDTVVVRYTVTDGASQSLFEDITFTPIGSVGSQRIVYRDGAWRS